MKHTAQPGIAFGSADLERHMAHPQARMAALSLVLRMTTEPLDQKQRKMFFGFRQVGRIQRTQNWVSLDANIKRGD